ncbi:MAG: TRAP transporter large permease subunit, partial [Pseudomonadota bacterium]
MRRDDAGAKDGFAIVDHLSRFSGLAVAQLYLICAAVTVYEIVARYVFHSPTSWAFEVAMSVCAVAWMISAGYVTLKKRHIGITVFYVMAGDRGKWTLDLVAMLVGVVALFLLADDAIGRALESVDIVEKSGSAFNSPQPAMLKSVLAIGALVYLAQLLVNLIRHFESVALRRVFIAVAGLIAVRLALTAVTHYTGDAGLAGSVHGAFSSVGEVFNPKDYIDARSYDLGLVSLVIVALLLALMTTGMPLGVVTLFVSVLTALAFFGPNGLYLVSSNAFGLLEKYPLVAVPLFVLMASILEKAGVARDLFDAMSIFAGNFRGGVAVQTIAVAVVLAAMSGVMGGEIVMLGLVALPQMLRLGYNPYIAIGV